jgi:hypothetical protein
MNYDLSHLTQDTRRVYGPIQDDEALLLYALVRCLGAKTVLEAGGQTGYSARNFLAAGATVYTVDTQPVPVQGDRHHVIQADIGYVNIDQLPRLDLVFFDAHAEEAQFRFFQLAVIADVIHDGTTVVVHDTGLHSQQFVPWAVPCGDRWAHQPEERRFVERLVAAGWQCVHVHSDDDAEPRHGLTILQRPRSLA